MNGSRQSGRMIAGMRGDDHGLRTGAFGETGGDGEHDAVAERNDGLFHRFLGMVAVRNRAAGAEQIGFEKTVHEIQRDDMMGDSMAHRMQFRERDLAGVVLGPIVEGQAGEHIV